MVTNMLITPKTIANPVMRDIVLSNSQVGSLTGSAAYPDWFYGTGHDFGAIYGNSELIMSAPIFSAFSYSTAGILVVRESKLLALNGMVDYFFTGGRTRTRLWGDRWQLLAQHEPDDHLFNQRIRTKTPARDLNLIIYHPDRELAINS